MMKQKNHDLVELVRSLLDDSGRLVAGGSAILDEALPVFGVKRGRIRELIQAELRRRRAFQRTPQRAPIYGADAPTGSIPVASLTMRHVHLRP